MKARRTALVALVTLAAIVLGSALPATAQDEAEPAAGVAAQFDDKVQILSAGVDEQSGVAELVVAIPPSFGEVSPDASNFALLQGGSRRGLLVEEVRNEVDVILVIDTSGSMRGEAIAAARSAATEFVEELPEGARVAVIGFGPQPVVASGLTDDRSDSRTAIASLNAAGETALWDAFVAAAELADEEGRSSRYVIVLSDGADTASSASFEEAVATLGGTEPAPGLYVVTLETAESDHSALVAAAEELRGQVLTTANSSELQALYGEIAGRLRSRYVVRFRPNDADSIVLSVAVDDAIATVRTTLTDIGGTAGVEPASATDDPGATGSIVNPTLGTVIVEAPGVLGSETALWIGAGTTFLALVVVFGLLSIPAMNVQPLAAARASDPRGRAASLNDRVSQTAERLIRQRDHSGTVDRSLDAAGLDIRAGEFVVLVGVSMISIGLIMSVVSGTLAAVFSVAVVGLAAVGYVNLRMYRRRNRFADQLQNSISIMTGSLRAGRGLPQALEMVAQEAPSPTRDEFRRVIVETRVGRDPVASLEAVADRMNSVDLEWMAQAIAINRELGGDLIELLENVAGTIRARNRLALQVRALSAEGRASGWVIMALPIVMYAYLQAVNPEYIALLHTTEPGVIASVVGILAMIAGGVWIRKLVNIQF